MQRVSLLDLIIPRAPQPYHSPRLAPPYASIMPFVTPCTPHLSQPHAMRLSTKWVSCAATSPLVVGRCTYMPCPVNLSQCAAYTHITPLILYTYSDYTHIDYMRRTHIFFCCSHFSTHRYTAGSPFVYVMLQDRSNTNATNGEHPQCDRQQVQHQADWQIWPHQCDREVRMSHMHMMRQHGINEDVPTRTMVMSHRH